MFFWLVFDRYEKGPIIVAKNKAYLEWENFFPDEGIAAAMLDRLLHHSKIVKSQGQSYRIAMEKRMRLSELEKG